MSASLVVIGDCHCRYELEAKAGGSRQNIRVTGRNATVGGRAALTALSASKQGINTAFFSSLGDDIEALIIKYQMLTADIDTTGLKLRTGYSSPCRWLIDDASDAKPKCYVDAGTAPYLAASEVPGSMLRDADVLHLDGSQAAAAIPAMEAAVNHDINISLDARALTPDIRRFVELANIIVATEDFAMGYTGKSTLEKAVEYLFDEGDTSFVIVRGVETLLGFDGVNYLRKSNPSPGANNATWIGLFLKSFISGNNFADCL